MIVTLDVKNCKLQMSTFLQQQQDIKLRLNPFKMIRSFQTLWVLMWLIAFFISLLVD